ncbi:dipeptidyl-peptidase 3 family protein [Aliikangiella maris]|uniref:Zn-dependent hydrolase n=2 Tax=Aliikangiella maris TaxID=3162458 RepID=A0ABV2BRV6_9GAMM
MKLKLINCFIFSLFILGCNQPSTTDSTSAEQNTKNNQLAESATINNQIPLRSANPRFNIYQTVALTSDLSHLSQNQKTMLGLLIDAAQIMDDLFWQQAFGNKQELLESITDPLTREFIEINYGPWDRLNNNKPFIKGYGEKPEGAKFYPADMQKSELETANFKDAQSLYSLIKRNADGALYAVPYHEAYKTELTQAATLLQQAAKYADNTQFAEYLNMRADALLTDNYQPSDFAWMDMKDNPIELVIGPIETYEDLLFGYRSAYEAYVLIKDQQWSQRLTKYAGMLPALQRDLPVDEKYKQEKPGSNSDLNAYDVIYYAGHSNAGSKTIAINLPNDEQVQLEKGTRRLQLKNAMKAKFEHILVPIANELIAQDQRQFVKFDAFFANTMFHEVAHGLGIKNTINNKGTVRTALKEAASAFEEGKADILGLYMVSKLYDSGHMSEGSLMDNYVTFLAGIFRSIRFGAASAHGKANMVRFNYFKEKGAFTRNERTGLYRINFDAMTIAMNELSNILLTVQGNGDYQRAVEILENWGTIGEQLEKDLQRIDKSGIPVDITFKQGKEILGLKGVKAR